MTAPIDTVALDPLKAKHRTMWAFGDYAAVAAEIIPTLGPILVEAAGVGAEDHVLDVAAGTGNAAIPAARLGASVVASDLTPALLEHGRSLASAAGVDVRWDEGDAEALPYGDDSFDVVLSCVGVMFAPHHQDSADELVRVCRPGGTIGLLSWTPTGFIGQMFATMRPYVPAAPAGVQPPPLWGDESHVRTLLGDRVEDVRAERKTVRVEFEDAAGFRDYFKRCYGPTIAAYNGLADNPERQAALDADLLALAQRFDRGDATTVLDWEYLLVVARVAPRAA